MLVVEDIRPSAMVLDSTREELVLSSEIDVLETAVVTTLLPSDGVLAIVVGALVVPKIRLN